MIDSARQASKASKQNKIKPTEKSLMFRRKPGYRKNPVCDTFGISLLLLLYIPGVFGPFYVGIYI